jgi:hypothetical protein
MKYLHPWSLPSLALALAIGLLHGPLGAQVQVAGELFVSLDAADPSAGTEEWANQGTLGDFVRLGAPTVDDINGAAAVSFIQGDGYQSPVPAPAGLVGLNPTRTIEAWVYNPVIADEETIVAWGHRGGPAGTNMSFNYGANANFGAIGHWDAPDIGWGTLPMAGQWHHLAYTFDGQMTRVYADGVLTNSENLGAGVINTHSTANTRITLAKQLNNANGDLNLGALEGTLSIGRLRVHDGVLSDAQIMANYQAEKDQFPVPSEAPVFLNAPASDTVLSTETRYLRSVDLSGFPPPTLEAISPAGARLLANNAFSYNYFFILPTPQPASFEVAIRATNIGGSVEARWTVTLRNPPPLGNLQVAERLFVRLDASDESAGTENWLNNGVLVGNFSVVGAPIKEEVGGATALTFNAGDGYVSANNAPPSLVGQNPTRSIEVWAFNPVITDEETMVAWGRRGGPAGTDMGFNYGSHAVYGAVTHWDAPDIGWGNVPAAGRWHHLVYTYDGTTTRVYSDGELANSEVLGAGVINTFSPTKIVIAKQLTDGVNLDFGPREALLSMAKIRVHDGVLTPAQVLNNFNAERNEFGIVDVPPAFTNAPADDRVLRGAPSYGASVTVTGFPVPAVEALEPAGAVVTRTGTSSFAVEYDLPAPAPASFTVRLRATNSGGSAEESWVVTVVDPTGTVEVAGELFVSLDAGHDTAGTAEWANQGTNGDFAMIGAPFVEELDGALGVTFNAGDAYQNVNASPDGLVGPDPTRSIEAWVYNPTIDAEETIVAWGWRGGPAGTNMSFNYGTNGAFGAIGHWDAPDIGWNNAGGAPRPQQWHHLAYTYDGSTTRVFVDGELANQEFLGTGRIITHCCSMITLATQLLPPDGVGLDFGPREGTLSIGRLRIHDGVLTPFQVQNNYLSEKDGFPVPGAPPVILYNPDQGEAIRGDLYDAFLRVDGFPVPALTALEPAGVTFEAAGPGLFRLVYQVPNGAPNFVTVRVRASNIRGDAEATWSISVRNRPVAGQIAVAEEMFVNLSAEHASAGTEEWTNNGSLGEFLRAGGPALQTVHGVKAVAFDGIDDAYQCADDAPEGLVGLNPTRSIEVWVNNPQVAIEETLVSWARRGGPAGTNMSFNYGTHGAFGAVGHWDAPDIGWNDAGGAPAPSAWHHLVYTYDGTTTRVYADGALSNREFLGPGVIDTYFPSKITIASQIEPDGVSLTGGLKGSLSIARVRVHDGVLLPAEVLHNFDLEKASLGFGFCPTEGQPEFGDTACTSLTLSGPAGNGPGEYTATAAATDGTQGQILYLFTANNNVDPPTVIGPQPENSAKLQLGIGDWSVTVLVDDNLECADQSPNVLCSAQVQVREVTGVAFIRGDANADGGVNIADASFLLNFLFLGGREPTCFDSLDGNDDGTGNIADASYILNFLFLGGRDIPPPNACGQAPLAEPANCAAFGPCQ